jgi:hypothetical protein
MTPSEVVSFGGREWTGLKRRLVNRYAQLTEADLAYVPGEEEALFARLAARTMETRGNIERFLRDECGCRWGGARNRRAESDDLKRGSRGQRRGW